LPREDGLESVRGVWVPQATFYRHKQLDKACIDIEDDPEAHERPDFIVRQAFADTDPGYISPPKSPVQIKPIRDPDSATLAHGFTYVETTPVYSSTLQDETNSISQAVQDLHHLTKVINQSFLSLSFTHLVFDRPPKGDYISPLTISPDTPNSGHCKLKIEARENASFLSHEHKMFQSIITLKCFDPPASLASTITVVTKRVSDEIQRLDGIKAAEWERQCSVATAPKRDCLDIQPDGPIQINTGKSDQSFFCSDY